MKNAEQNSELDGLIFNSPSCSLPFVGNRGVVGARVESVGQFIELTGGGVYY